MKTLITSCGALCLLIPLATESPEKAQADHQRRRAIPQPQNRIDPRLDRDNPNESRPCASPGDAGCTNGRCDGPSCNCVASRGNSSCEKVSDCSNRSCATPRQRLLERLRSDCRLRRPQTACGGQRRRGPTGLRNLRVIPPTKPQTGVPPARRTRPDAQAGRRPILGPNRGSNPVPERQTALRRSDDRPRAARPEAKATIAWRENVDRAVTDSIETKRPLLMKFSATWCAPCQRLKRETLSAPGLARQVNQSVVPVDIDIDRAEELARDLRVEAVPTILIVSPDGRILDRVAGFQNVRQMQEMISRTVQAQKVPIPPVAGASRR